MFSLLLPCLEMRPLTLDQKTQIVELSRGRTNREVALEFSLRHPERIIGQSTVQRVLLLLKSTGSLHRKKRNAMNALSNTAGFVEQVRSFVENNPFSSISEIASNFDCSRYIIHKILRKKLGFFPYKKQMHQQLMPHDHIKRRQFCRTMVRLNASNPEMIKKILWSDEKQFTLTASFNRQNHRYVINSSDAFSDVCS